MAPAQNGDKVKIHYTGKLDDGSVFDSSEGGAPLEFTLGQGQVIAGFDQGVVGMELGDSKTLNIPVVEIDDSRVKMDANHPLAGKNLTFDIQLVEINQN